MNRGQDSQVLKNKIQSLQRKICCDKQAVENSMTTYTVFLDGVAVQEFSLPTLSNRTINIILD